MSKVEVYLVIEQLRSDLFAVRRERDEALAIIQHARQRVDDAEEAARKATGYHSVVEQLAIQADLAEQERDEARAEVGRLKETLDAATIDNEEWEGANRDLARERNKAREELAALVEKTRSYLRVKKSWDNRSTELIALQAQIDWSEQCLERATLPSSLMESASSKLAQGLAKVKQIAAQLRELRKQQSDEALKRELLVNETILLMAVVDFEKAGVQPTEERW